MLSVDDYQGASMQVLAVAHQRRTVLIAALGLITLLGCNPVENIKTKSRTARLDEAVDTYRKLIRWGYFEQAAQYLKPRDGSPERPDISGLKRFKVTSYSVADQWLTDTGEEARVVASIEFDDVDSGIARALRDEQMWWYDWDSERWYLGTSLPDFVSAK